MATLRPFRALRPRPDVAADIISLPYDVMDENEARQLAEGNPHSFLHIIRPEIDLPEDVDVHDDRVYNIGADNLKRYVESEYALHETDDALYVYQISTGGHTQAGLFGCVSVKEYDHGVIVRHEKTRPAKEEDRTRHILAQRAHAEPVMLVYRDQNQIDEYVEATTSTDPLYDITTPDGIRHTVWRIANIEEVTEAFDRVERLYVADGHHRCKAASRAAKALSCNGEKDTWAACAYFPAAIFPMSVMRVLPYNRVVHKLPGTPKEFLDNLDRRMKVKRNTGISTPPEKGQVSVYLDGTWHLATLPPTRRSTLADTLDVARLNEHVLEPLLGIDDPRTDPNLDFVGGDRGPEELEVRVDSGRDAVAFSMYPTDTEELIQVSDAGLLMPPKSTWFDPKLCSGLLVHLFDD